MIGQEHFVEFVAHTLAGNLVRQFGMGRERAIRVWMVLKFEGVFKTNRAKDAKVIFENAFVRVADEADEFFFESGLTTHGIKNWLGKRIAKNAVDGEVTAFGIVFGVREQHGVRATSVGIAAVGTER